MNRLSVEEAAALVAAGVRSSGPERVPLERALGRVLHDDALSTVTLPPWNNSSMDGYAVHAADVANASTSTAVTLPVLETIAAGSRATRPLPRGAAMRIMTGAPVPEGCDTVIRVEDTDAGLTSVTIRDGRDAGRNVRPRGEDLREGELAIPAGTVLGPGAIGVLASIGMASVAVHRMPRVAIVASGDELVDVDRIDEVRRGDRIISSNTYSLAAAVRQAGGDVAVVRVVPDDPARLRAAVEEGSGADLLLTSGGVSVGAFDYTRDVLRDLGAETTFWRVRMRPGAPVGFGRVRETPWIGLPGNPVSALVTFELFAKPAIRILRGERLPFPRTVPVVVDEAIDIAAPLTHFLRGVVGVGEGGVLHARLTGGQGSGLLTSMARANALLVVAAERPHVDAGERVPAILLGDGATSTDKLDLA